MILNPKKVLAAKLGNAVLRRAAASALIVCQRFKRLARRPRHQWQPKVSQIERFDKEHDRLWAEVKGEYPCAVVRDASFLNWKFVEQPGQDFLRIELRRGEKVVAVACLVVREPDADYGYRRALLADVVLSASDRQVIWATLDAVRRASVERDADTVVFDVTHKNIERCLTEYGFMARAATRVLLLATEGLSVEAKRLAMNPDHWFLTKADSDIDRPW